MCLICVDLAKGKLTTNEAKNNLKETREEISEDHFIEVLEIIWDKENEERE